MKYLLEAAISMLLVPVVMTCSEGGILEAVYLYGTCRSFRTKSGVRKTLQRWEIKVRNCEVISQVAYCRIACGNGWIECYSRCLWTFKNNVTRIRKQTHLQITYKTSSYLMSCVTKWATCKNYISSSVHICRRHTGGKNKTLWQIHWK
jgi:hypothetical protein